MTSLLLNDDANTQATIVAQQMGRLELRCSVCESRVEQGYELDASSRCQECQS